jgi:hypothetical protein
MWRRESYALGLVRRSSRVSRASLGGEEFPLRIQLTKLGAIILEFVRIGTFPNNAFPAELPEIMEGAIPQPAVSASPGAVLARRDRDQSS